MNQPFRFVGLDVHADSIVVQARRPAAEGRFRRSTSRYGAAVRLGNQHSASASSTPSPSDPM